jgi:hypothetical protein
LADFQKPPVIINGPCPALNISKMINGSNMFKKYKSSKTPLHLPFMKGRNPTVPAGRQEGERFIL